MLILTIFATISQGFVDSYYDISNNSVCIYGIIVVPFISNYYDGAHCYDYFVSSDVHLAV